MNDYWHNELRIEASGPALRRLKAKLRPEALGASAGEGFALRDWHTGLHVRYRVAGGGFARESALAARARSARFTLSFERDGKEASGFVRWQNGHLATWENDDPTLGPNRDELWREGVLLTSEVDDYDSTVLAPSRWAAVCGRARQYGWRPSDELVRAFEASREPVAVGDLANTLGHVRLDVALLPAEEALRLADALDAAADAFGVPLAI